MASTLHGRVSFNCPTSSFAWRKKYRRFQLSDQTEEESIQIRTGYKIRSFGSWKIVSRSQATRDAIPLPVPIVSCLVCSATLLAIGAART